jgi:hypothetical protein
MQFKTYLTGHIMGWLIIKGTWTELNVGLRKNQSVKSAVYITFSSSIKGDKGVYYACQ